MKLKDIASWTGILLGMVTVALAGITLTAAASGTDGWTVGLVAAIISAAVTATALWIAYGTHSHNDTLHHA